ncbi:MAG: hypothetical protein ACLGIA_11510 [Actinomycetes bacterium]
MTGSGRRDVTVLLATPGLSDGVLDVLQDLSADGLVDPFVWAAGERASDTSLPALRVERGTLSGTTVEDELVSASYRTVRLAVLVSLLPGEQPVGSAAEQRLAEVASRSAGGARLVRLRLLLVRPGSKADPEDVARTGWHNVLLSPEDSAGPGRGRLVHGSEPDQVDVGRLAAPLVASLAGLWADVEHGPLDEQRVLPGEYVVPSRSFYRRLRAAYVQSELSGRVLSLDTGFPLPSLQGAITVYVDDVELATSDMARALWTRHQGVLKGPRTRPVVEETAPVSMWAALGMMFRFIWAALRGAPGQWYAAVLNRASSAVASAVHATVFGSAPAAYQVVVRGMTAEGLPAGWRELGDASDRLDGLLDDEAHARQHEVRGDLSALWKDYVAGAMTLVDAGERATSLPPVQVGADRGVLRRAKDCVPPPRDAFRDVPAHLAAVTGVRDIEPYDVLGAHNLDQCLRSGSEDSSVSVSAERTAQQLREWRSDHQRSYAVQVGNQLGQALLATAREVQDLLRTLSDAADVTQVDDAERAHQLRVAQHVRLLLWLLVGVLVLIGVARWASWITPLRTLVLCLSAVAAWAVASLVVFVRGQRELFRELHRRRTLVAEADAAKANLKQATRDVRRLSDAYSQFLSWSRVLGVVLDAPFGPPPPPGWQGNRTTDGLPHCADVAVARPDEQALRRAATGVRQYVYTAGWLRGPWQQTLATASTGSGGDKDLAEDLERLFSDRGAGSGSHLDVWSQQLAQRGLGPRTRQEHWASTLGRLRDDERRSVTAAVLARVQSVRPGSPVVSRGQFLQGLDTLPVGNTGPEAWEGPVLFEPSAFSPEALAGTRNRMARAVLSRAEHGLGQVAVLTQLGEGLPVHDFTFTGTQERENVRRPIEDEFEF